MGVSSIDSQNASYWEEIFGVKSKQKEDDLAAKLFQDLDIDQSGGIGFKESGLDQGQFDALDTDKDGTISQTELQAGLEMQRQSLFTQMKLAFDSAGQSGQGQTSFDAMDTNHDGIVSQEELNAALENQKTFGNISGQLSGENRDLLNTTGKMSAQSILASIARAYQGTDQSLGFALTA